MTGDMGPAELPVQAAATLQQSRAIPQLDVVTPRAGAAQTLEQTAGCAS